MLPGAGARREHWLAVALLVAIVLYRSGVLVFWPQAHFDSDGAITGLMAKHLAEGQAFPLFYYGQSYMLGVEAYLAAPLFAIFGPSVTALKLPLLAINLAVALLLLRMLERDAGLPARLAVVPVLFFALPAPGTAARMLEPNGGNLAPFLYVVLLWALRHRPVWCGIAFGIGFLQREFTLYGLVALLVVDILARRIVAWRELRRWGVMLVAAGLVWSIVQWGKQWSSAAGPGTTMADVYQPRNNIAELVTRTCLDASAALGGVSKIVADHWPVLFGTQRVAVFDFGIDSTVWQGLDWSWIALAVLVVSALAVIVIRLAAERRWRAEYEPCAYLLLVGGLSVSGYLVGRCGDVGFYWMRYDLLSLLGAVGLGGWFMVAAASTRLRAWWAGLLCGWLAVTAIVHGRIWVEYLTHPPVGGKQAIIRELDARHVRYALADYWMAYAITFLTNERIIVASDTFLRIPAYNRLVEQHRGEAIRISRVPCEGGEEVVRRLYFCRP
jgi:hypothetical protein